MKFLKNNLVPIAVFLLCLLSFHYAGVSLSYLSSEVYTRFIRNTLFVLALILIVAVLTFLSCVAGAVCIVACVGLSLLAILCLLAGQTVGCIAMFVLAFLVSPFGLPALGGWLVERLHGVKYAAMDFMAS